MANSLAQYLADLQVQIKEAESRLVFGVVISTSPLRVKYGEITLEDNFLFVEDGVTLTVGQKVPMLKTNRSQLFIVMLSKTNAKTTGTKSTSGYVKFDNGIKLNWVQVTISAGTRGKAFSWPSAFTSAVYATWASSEYYDMQGGVDGATKTGGTVNAGACSNGGTVGVAITWTAYGIGV